MVPASHQIVGGMTSESHEKIDEGGGEGASYFLVSLASSSHQPGGPGQLQGSKIWGGEHQKVMEK